MSANIKTIHLIFEKFNLEIEPIIFKISEIHQNSSKIPLLRCKTYNVHRDENLWGLHFSSLIQDTQRKADSENKRDMPKASVNTNKHSFITS